MNATSLSAQLQPLSPWARYAARCWVSGQCSAPGWLEPSLALAQPAVEFDLWSERTWSVGERMMILLAVWIMLMVVWKSMRAIIGALCCCCRRRRRSTAPLPSQQAKAAEGDANGTHADIATALQQQQSAHNLALSSLRAEFDSAQRELQEQLSQAQSALEQVQLEARLQAQSVKEAQAHADAAKEAAKDAAAMRQHMQQLEAELAESEARTQQNAESEAQLRTQLQQAQQASEADKASIGELKEQVSALTTLKTELETQLRSQAAARATEKAALEERLAQSERQAQQRLDEALTQARSEAATALASAESRAREVATKSSEAQLRSLREQLATEAASSRESLAKHVAEQEQLQSELTRMTEQLTQLAKEREAHSAASDVAARLESLQSERAATQLHHETQVRELNTRIDDLQQRLDSQTAAEHKLKEEAQSTRFALELQVQKLSSENSALQTQLSELQTQLSSTTQQHLARVAELESELNGRCALLQAQCDSQREQLKETHAARVSELQQELDQSRSEVAASRKERDRLQRSLESLQAANKELEQKLQATLAPTPSSPPTATTTGETSAIEAEGADMEQRCAKLIARVEETEANMLLLHEGLHEAIAHAKALRDTNDDLQSQLALLKGMQPESALVAGALTAPTATHADSRSFDTLAPSSSTDPAGTASASAVPSSSSSSSTLSIPLSSGSCGSHGSRRSSFLAPESPGPSELDMAMARRRSSVVEVPSRPPVGPLPVHDDLQREWRRRLIIAHVEKEEREVSEQLRAVREMTAKCERLCSEVDAATPLEPASNAPHFSVSAIQSAESSSLQDATVPAAALPSGSDPDTTSTDAAVPPPTPPRVQLSRELTRLASLYDTLTSRLAAQQQAHQPAPVASQALSPSHRRSRTDATVAGFSAASESDPTQLLRAMRRLERENAQLRVTCETLLMRYAEEAGEDAANSIISPESSLAGSLVASPEISRARPMHASGQPPSDFAPLRLDDAIERVANSAPSAVSSVSSAAAPNPTASPSPARRRGGKARRR